MEQREVVIVRDWSAEPLTHGAYGYALVGGEAAGRTLARVHQGTLALAGEALAEASGTVEGGLAAGQRAARAPRRPLRR